MGVGSAGRRRAPAGARWTGGSQPARGGATGGRQHAAHRNGRRRFDHTGGRAPAGELSRHIDLQIRQSALHRSGAGAVSATAVRTDGLRGVPAEGDAGRPAMVYEEWLTPRGLIRGGIPGCRGRPPATSVWTRSPPVRCWTWHSRQRPGRSCARWPLTWCRCLRIAIPAKGWTGCRHAWLSCRTKPEYANAAGRRCWT
ncbi:hypothetical protein G6F57_018671 [Rhizopus arrhizus]|nr:hypothetical protein G6F57_018671 [Rhizopus arrhizus]